MKDYGSCSQMTSSCKSPIAVQLYFSLVINDKLLKAKEKTNSGYKHNKKVSHGIINLTFRMLQHTSSEGTVTRYDKI